MNLRNIFSWKIALDAVKSGLVFLVCIKKSLIKLLNVISCKGVDGHVSPQFPFHYHRLHSLGFIFLVLSLSFCLSFINSIIYFLWFLGVSRCFSYAKFEFSADLLLNLSILLFNPKIGGTGKGYISFWKAILGKWMRQTGLGFELGSPIPPSLDLVYNYIYCLTDCLSQL